MDRLDLLSILLLMFLSAIAYRNGGWALFTWTVVGTLCGYGLAAAKAARIFMREAEKEAGEGEK